MSINTPRSAAPANRAAISLTTPEARTEMAASRPRWSGGIEYGAASRRGSYHPENEDSYLLPSDEAPAAVAVADGVGGGARGKVASRTMIERIRLLTAGLLVRPTALRDWLLASDDSVSAEISRNADRAGAATFVAALPSWGGRRWHLTWAGDCRAYRITVGNTLQCLTRDDTYGNLRESPPDGAGPDDPARMVGNGAVDQANLADTQLAGGEILFLCSDGVHRFVPEDLILSILRGPESLERRCHQLATTAHNNGGSDDATVVAVERHRWFGLGEGVWWLLISGLALAGASLSISHPVTEDLSSPPAPPRASPSQTPPTPSLPARAAPPPASPSPPATPPAAILPPPVPNGTLAGGPQPADLASPTLNAPRTAKPARQAAPTDRRSNGAAPAGEPSATPAAPKAPTTSTPAPAPATSSKPPPPAVTAATDALPVSHPAPSKGEPPPTSQPVEELPK